MESNMLYRRGKTGTMISQLRVAPARDYPPNVGVESQKDRIEVDGRIRKKGTVGGVAASTFAL